MNLKNFKRIGFLFAAGAALSVVSSCEILLPLPEQKPCRYNYECLPIGRRLMQSERVLFLCRGPAAARHCDWGFRDEDHDGEIAVGASEDPTQRDCDDRDERRGSRMTEVLDGLDNDCDGLVDEDVARLAPVVDPTPLFEGAMAYRLSAADSGEWVAYSPSTAALSIGDSLRVGPAVRNFEIGERSAFRSAIGAASVTTMGAMGVSPPAVVAMIGRVQRAPTDPDTCQVDRLGVALANGQQLIGAAEPAFRIAAWEPALGSPDCSTMLTQMRSPSVASVSGTDASRRLLFAWTQPGLLVPNFPSCELSTVTFAALNLNIGSQLVSPSAPVAIVSSANNGQIAIQPIGGGRALIVFSADTGLGLALVNDTPSLIQFSTIPGAAGGRLTDPAFASGGSGQSSLALVYLARPACTATAGIPMAQRVRVVDDRVEVDPPLTLGTSASAVSIRATTVAQGAVVAPFSRGGRAAATDPSVVFVSWLVSEVGMVRPQARRVWSADFALLDEAPLTAAPFADTLLSDRDGVPFFALSQPNTLGSAQVEAITISTTRQVQRTVWLQRPSTIVY